MTTRDSNERRLNVPLDMIGLLGIYLVLLPVTLIGSEIFFGLLNARRSGDTTLLWLAVGVGAIGVILLFLAKLPLYRERRFLQIGPAGMDCRHRRLYWWAWLFIVASVGLLGLILVALW